MQTTLFKPVVPLNCNQFPFLDYSQCIPLSITGSYEYPIESDTVTPKLPHENFSISFCDKPKKLSLTSKNIRSTHFNEITDNDRNTRVFDWINTIQSNSPYPFPCCY
ncbi:hypothetical protein EDI_209330 [Entamoeba dispar SAW760]|uniref:Uncharacterized protein n=1 Tax=Entamoeba dispar (strain ATCC PRA-260 / SAW760) TaxID=370354 RepID=B0EEB8_ENTDS|nr:uncharacterized protein EDI_209330 [Entamoeba dispar SAW760]EDR27125.1 hypothetical protein EDI_209330 [Entamoeba dispar SAW760]|eukprot:EDR27125.1 hypothetical protein EDI_209330 [Entamoeba dispar SAW760]